MTEKIRRVVVHGPPDPDEHPWVILDDGHGGWGYPRRSDLLGALASDVKWVPWEPPSELAPEPEGVEVDGERWRLSNRGWIQMLDNGEWFALWKQESTMKRVRVAQALGLVDQPKVPKALVDWLWTAHAENALSYGLPNDVAHADGAAGAYKMTLDAIEAGEFGPAEPPVTWVTDRLPNDDEYPVAWTDVHDPDALIASGEWRDTKMDTDDLDDGWRWVSLSVLLDAAGLGER